MAYIASSEYSRVTSDTHERRGPRFGMEKGTRVNPGQILFQGKYIDQNEFLKVSEMINYMSKSFKIVDRKVHLILISELDIQLKIKFNLRC